MEEQKLFNMFIIIAYVSHGNKNGVNLILQGLLTDWLEDIQVTQQLKTL